MHTFKELTLVSIAAAGTFLSPVFGIMFLVGLAIIIDTATGIWKAKRTGVKVTSRGLQGLVAKMFFYQGVVLLLFLLDKLILNDVMLIVWDKVPYITTKIAALVLVYIEVMSIDENYKAVKGISIISQFKKLMTKIKRAKDEISDFKGKDSNEDTIETGS